MVKRKGNPLENVGTRLRELLDEIDRLLSPQQPRRARVPVPVPARPPRPRRHLYSR